MENIKIEELLNKIYIQPDLKDDVFNFINPIIIQAYSYLNQDQNNLLIGVEQQTQLKNIIFKDVTNLINTYTALPITYRNEKKIKNDKTHRQMLIGNLELIARKMKKIEDEIYEHFDREMTVTGRVLESKYSDVAFEKDSISEKMEDNFQWNAVKTQIESQAHQQPMNADNIFVKDNSKIAFNNGQMSFAVKNKGQYYIDKMIKVVKSFKNSISNIVDVIIDPFVITIVGMITFVVVIFGGLIYVINVEEDERKLVDDIYNMVEIAKNSNLSKDQFSQNILMNAAKQYKVMVVQNNKELVLKKELPQKSCINFISDIKRNNINQVYVNNAELTEESEKRFSLKSNTEKATNVKKAICNLPEKNVINIAVK